MPTNGSGARHLPNWIDAFVASTDNLSSPPIFRRWTAISTIAATLELKVWATTDTAVYPNIYTFLIGHPGTGKSRTISVSRKLYMTLPEHHLAPISLTFAAMIDALETKKRKFIRQPEGEVTYNTMYICADEMGTFIHKYEPEMTAGLSHFYDPAAYQQERRGREHKTRIECGLLNILAGSTPQNLMSYMPENAWGQGFCSRVVFVFSDARIKKSLWTPSNAKPEDLAHDLKCINSLHGEFTITQLFKDAMDQWQALGEPPTPDHPKLTHYITRRPLHLLRLAMISSISKSSGLILTEEDFLTALEWLVEAETAMPDIFKAGAVNADSSAMDEIQHHVRVNDLHGTGVSEQRVVHFARERIPITSILRIIEIMIGAGMIRVNRTDKKTGARFLSAAPLVKPSFEPFDVAAPPTPSGLGEL